MVEDAVLLGKVALAALLGGLIGLEREVAQKPAGLRTNMLVSAVSALLVGLGFNLALAFPVDSLIRSDPIRIIEAIIVGISFLGAGTIFRAKGDVQGLTTGASLLMAGGVGLSVGLERYLLAGGVAVLTLVINWLVGKMAYKAKV